MAPLCLQKLEAELREARAAAQKAHASQKEAGMQLEAAAARQQATETQLQASQALVAEQQEALEEKEAAILRLQKIAHTRQVNSSSRSCIEAVQTAPQRLMLLACQLTLLSVTNDKV